MKKLLRSLAAVALSLSLTTGVAAASSIGTTGPSSRNNIESRSSENRRVDNNNNVRVRNDNPQSARTGDATADYNTTAGDAQTGAASNDSLLRGTVTLDNGSANMDSASAMNAASQSGAINNTGPNSSNNIRFNTRSDLRVNNTNNLSVENNNRQSATSGTAVVSGNTTGGSAMSGDASNISTVDLSFNVTN